MEVVAEVEGGVGGGARWWGAAAVSDGGLTSTVMTALMGRC
jgi:hypothetical protein